PRTGEWNAFLRYSNTDWLFYPVELEGGTNYLLEFYARQDGTGATNASVSASYGTSNTSEAMTNTIVGSTGIINGEYQLISGIFTPATSGTYYIGINGTINSSPWYISIDDISLDLAPSCIVPTDLTTENITYESADLLWASDGDTFDISWGEGTFDAEAGTIVNGFENGGTLSGLEANTTYQYYVRNDCGGGDVSDWAGPYDFYTGYCIPTGTSNSYRITGVSTEGGYLNISNLSNGNANPYSDYSNLVVSQSPGEDVTYTVNVPSSTAIKIWIDWDQNLSFDDDELVASHTTYTGAGFWTGMITVPEDQNLGDYRIRIRSGYY